MSLGAAALLLGAPAAARTCQPTGFPGLRPQGRHVQFVGAATADTVLAGPQGWMPDTMPGVYGQRMRVERVSAVLPPAVRQALARGEAVLVPWSYARCRTERFRGSARWARPGSRGLFWGALRDPAHWAGGRPTIDLQWMGGQPYDAFVMERGGFPTPPGATPEMDSTLTAEELLAFYDLLPPTSVFDEAAPDTAWSVEPLRRWAREHPTLAARYPANHLLRLTAGSLEELRARSVRVPIVGTYRFVVTLGTGDSLAVFARTKGGPGQVMRSSTGADDDPAPADPLAPSPTPDGYYVQAVVALAPGSIPATRVAAQGGTAQQFWFAISAAPVLRGSDSTVWRGDADLLGAAARLLDDAGDSDGAAALRAAVRRVGEIQSARAPDYLPGRFVRDRAGRVRFESAVRVDGRPLIVIRGERISTDLLRER